MDENVEDNKLKQQKIFSTQHIRAHLHPHRNRIALSQPATTSTNQPPKLPSREIQSGQAFHFVCRIEIQDLVGKAGRSEY